MTTLCLRLPVPVPVSVSVPVSLLLLLVFGPSSIVSIDCVSFSSRVCARCRRERKRCVRATVADKYIFPNPATDHDGPERFVNEFSGATAMVRKVRFY